MRFWGGALSGWIFAQQEDFQVVQKAWVLLEGVVEPMACPGVDVSSMAVVSWEVVP